MGKVNQEGEFIRVLDDGTVMVDHGPMLMSISVSNRGVPEIKLAREGGNRALETLMILARFRHVITQKIGDLTSVDSPDSFPPLIRKMITTVRKFDDSNITPLIAVAGAGADEVANFIFSTHQAGKVVVNNGGDIAIRLRTKEIARVGIKTDITEKAISHVLTLTGRSGVGGVATSGFGGRSFTMGVANAAVVLANNAIIADVAATLVGNSTNVESPSVKRTLARDLYQSTDIPDHLVTTKIGYLSRSEIEEALDCGIRKAQALQDKGLIIGAFIAVRDQTRFSEPISPFIQQVCDFVAI